VHATFGLINSTPFSSRLAAADMVELLSAMALDALDAVTALAHGGAARSTAVTS
jgi:hypothetical protein